jgi:hypothetical protein
VLLPANVPCSPAARAGFDAWLANDGGTYTAPSFQTYNIAGKPDGGWTGSSNDYTTAVVGNASIAWIESVAHKSKPWFAYIAPKAARALLALDPSTPGSPSLTGCWLLADVMLTQRPAAGWPAAH